MKLAKCSIFIITAAICCSLTISQAFALTQPKKTVAVADFENKAGVGSYVTMGTGMADMLTDSLIKSGQFTVLERQALGAVMAEQNLAASNRSSQAGTGAQTGNIKKAQILIQGAVTEFQENKSGGGQGVSLYGFNVGANSAAAHVAVIIRLIDTTTSEVLSSERVEGEAKSGGLAFSGGVGPVGFGQSGFTSTPLGKATQMAIDRAVSYISAKLASVPWKGKVIKTDDKGMVLINAGSAANMTAGTVLKVSRKGESILDPDTGMELGSDAKPIGTIRIETVEEKFSKAKPIQISEPAQQGDILELIG